MSGAVEPQRPVLRASGSAADENVIVQNTTLSLVFFSCLYSQHQKEFSEREIGVREWGFWGGVGGQDREEILCDALIVGDRLVWGCLG